MPRTNRFEALAPRLTAVAFAAVLSACTHAPAPLPPAPVATPAPAAAPAPNVASSPFSVGFANRGVIEGFYGPPWSHQDRLDMIRFMGRVGMNMYFYGPKDDPFHREKWREP